MRIFSVALASAMVVAALVVLSMPAQAQNSPIQVEKLTPDNATLEQPPPTLEPKAPGKSATPGTEKKGRVGGPSAPKKAPARLEAKSTEGLETEVPTETVQLGRSSLRRQKVMRIDNQPHPRIRPIAVIPGALGPYGYLEAFMAGQTHANKEIEKAKAKAAPKGANGQPGQPGNLQNLRLGGRGAERRGGR